MAEQLKGKLLLLLPVLEAWRSGRLPSTASCLVRCGCCQPAPACMLCMSTWLSSGGAAGEANQTTALRHAAACGHASCATALLCAGASCAAGGRQRQHAPTPGCSNRQCGFPVTAANSQGSPPGFPHVSWHPGSGTTGCRLRQRQHPHVPTESNLKRQSSSSKSGAGGRGDIRAGRAAQQPQQGQLPQAQQALQPQLRAAQESQQAQQGAAR